MGLVACGSAQDESTAELEANATHTTLLSPNGEEPLADNVCSGVSETGTYCGSTLKKEYGATDADPDTNYFCHDGQTYAAVACVGGCSSETQGTEDYCRGSRDQKIVISEFDQRMRIYDGDRCVREIPVSTGKPGFATRLNSGKIHDGYPVLQKKMLVRMSASNFNGESYDTKGVPWDVQLTSWGIYLHGAFWSKYGTNPNCGHCGIVQGGGALGHGYSHGCINERVQDARWVYMWLPPKTDYNVVEFTDNWFQSESCDEGSFAPGPCFSNTIFNRTASYSEATKSSGSCVQSESDSKWYVCNDTQWQEISADAMSECSSKHALTD